MTVEDLLEGWPVRCEADVAWGQMDAFGHVNNTVYFRWFEDVRILLLRDVGWLEAMEATGVGPILARTQCVFRAPLAWPDRVTVAAKVDDLAVDRFTMKYRLVSHQAGVVAAEGDGRIVSFDYRANAKAPIPKGVFARLEAL